MKRWKWIRRTLAALALLIVLLWIAQALFLATVVRSQILAQLRAIGLDSADLTVDRIGLSGAELTDLKLDDGELFSIHRLDVGYSLGEVFGGKIDTLRLTGVELSLSYRDGSFDLGPLAGLGLPQGDQGGELPFDRLEIRSSVLRLIVEANQRPQLFVIPFDGSVDRSGDKLVLRFDAHVRDRRVWLKAQMLRGDGRVTITTLDVDAEAPRLDGFQHLGPVHATAIQPVVVQYGDGIRLSAPEVEIRTGDYASSVADGSWRIASTAWRIAPLEFDGSRLLATLVSSQPLRAEGPGVVLAADSVGGKVEALFAKGAPPKIEGSVNITGGSGTFADADVAISGIDGDISLSLNGDTKPKASLFTIDKVTYKGREFPSLTGSASATGDGVVLTARWPITSEALADASITASRDKTSITAQLPPSELSGLKNFLGGFIDLSGVELGGKVAAELTADQSLNPQLKLTFDDASYRAPSAQTTLEGVTGHITFDSLKPLHTPGGQKLLIQKYQQGKVAFTGGSLAFRVESPDTYFIERTDWTLGNRGRITAHAIRYNRLKPSIDTELFVDDLNLEDWLAVLTNEKVAATGQLYGRVPLRIRTRDGKYQVAFGEGFLYSTALTGTLKIPDAQGVSTMLSQADPRFANDPQFIALREKLSGALTDFEYSSFRFDLIPKEDRSVTLRVVTRGKGRGPDGLPVDPLTVNFNGFDKAANLALFGQSLFQGE